MRRVRLRQYYLCNKHLAERLPISGRVIVQIETELGCEMPHPEIERILHDAVETLANTHGGNTIHA